MANPKPLYMDHNATTPVDPRVLEAMLPYFSETFGNSMSLGHAYGWDADAAVEKARRQAAAFLNCDPKELVFTSGATESNNWAIEGLIEALRAEATPTRDSGSPTPIHFLISPVEHNSVLAAAERARRLFGVEVDMLPLNQWGQVDLDKIPAIMKPHTRLLAAMLVQNEIGSVNPIQKLTEICREHQVYLLSDATQALGKIPVDVQKTPVDLLSFSAHKLGGPKGVGFLYQRSRDPRVQLPALIAGGGHEKGARSGTLNVPGIVGLGKACEIAMQEGAQEQARIRELRDLLLKGLREKFPELRLNGHPDERSPNNLHVTFVNCQVPAALVGLAASRGSACLSGKTSMSHVLASLGFNETEAAQSLRLSLGRTTSLQDVHETIQLLASQIKPKSYNS